MLVAATGCRLSLAFLPDDLLCAGGEDVALYRGVMHPRAHDLFVIGMMKAICSIWPRSEQQMRFVAALLAGEYALPPQRAIVRAAEPVLAAPYGNCQFYTHDLRRELARGRA